MKIVDIIASAFWIVMPLRAQQQVVADAPEVRGPFTLNPFTALQGKAANPVAILFSVTATLWSRFPRPL